MGDHLKVLGLPPITLWVGGQNHQLHQKALSISLTTCGKAGSTTQWEGDGG